MSEAVQQSNEVIINSLDLKYRPEAFYELVGNDIFVQIINKGIRTNTLARTILLVSPPGNGKTTSGRLIGLEAHCTSPVTEESLLEANEKKNSLLLQSEEILQKLKSASIHDLGREQQEIEIVAITDKLNASAKMLNSKTEGNQADIDFKRSSISRQIKDLAAKLDSAEAEARDSISMEILELEQNLEKDLKAIAKKNNQAISALTLEVNQLNVDKDKLVNISEASLLALGHKRKNALEIQSGVLRRESDDIKLNKVGFACGNCPTCKDITVNLIRQGKQVQGVYELDGSKIKSKQEIVEIINQMTSRPLPPYTKKILILDEIQDLKQDLQDSFLKFFEEPPQHVTIILNTTNPENLKEAIKSRCRQYRLRKPSFNAVVERLRYICENEGKDYEMRALQMIVNKKNRGMRDCIVALETVFGLGAVTVENTVYQLDVISEQEYIDFFKATKGEVSEILLAVDNLEAKDVTFTQFMKEMSKFLVDCTKMKYQVKLEEYTDAFYKEARRVFEDYSYDQLLKILQIHDFYRSNLGHSHDEQKLAVVMFGLKISKNNILSIGVDKVKYDTAVENTKAHSEYNKVSPERYASEKFVEIDDTLENVEDVALAAGTEVVNKSVAAISDVMALLGGLTESVPADKEPHIPSKPAINFEDINDDINLE